MDQAPPSSRECDDVVELPVEKATALTNRRRLAILRALLTRRMMVSELEKVLGVKKQMLHEHARVLEAHGFVRSVRIPNRKPVYYELTPLGARFASPRMALIRLLSVAVACVTAGIACLVSVAIAIERLGTESLVGYERLSLIAGAVATGVLLVAIGVGILGYGVIKKRWARAAV